MSEAMPTINIQHLAELRQLLSSQNPKTCHFKLQGLGQHPTWSSRPHDCQATLICTKALPVECEIDAKDYVLSASANLPMNQLHADLDDLGLEVCFHSYNARQGSLGGLYSQQAAQLSWPSSPLLRDSVLGIEAIRADGTPFKAGGKVVKNVSGHDLTRFLCGAQGAHAVITRLHMKLQKKAKYWQQSRWQFENNLDLVACLRQLRMFGQNPLLCQWLPATCTLQIWQASHLAEPISTLQSFSKFLGPTTAEECSKPFFESSEARIRMHFNFSQYMELFAGRKSALFNAYWLAIHPFAQSAWIKWPQNDLQTARNILEELNSMGATYFFEEVPYQKQWHSLAQLQTARINKWNVALQEKWDPRNQLPGDMGYCQSCQKGGQT